MIVLTEIYTSLAAAQTLNVFTQNIIKMEIETQLSVQQRSEMEFWILMNFSFLHLSLWDQRETSCHKKFHLRVVTFCMDLKQI